MEWNEELLTALVAKAAAGDEEAWAELIRHYNTKLQFVARSKIQNEAEAADQVQNAWIKAYGHLSSLDDYSKFEPWIKEIVRNQCLDYYKSHSKKEDGLVFSDLETSEDNMVYEVEDTRIDSRPDLVYSEKTRQEIILSVLDQLPENQRIVTVMYFYDQMSLKQIAEELGVPMSTVVGRFQHAKSAIKASVTELQNRDGIKLYGMAPLPFFIWLLRFESQSGWLYSNIGSVSGAVNPASAQLAETVSAAAESASGSTPAASAASSAEAASAVSAVNPSLTNAAAKAVTAAPAASNAGKIIGAVAVIGAVAAGSVAIPRMINNTAAPVPYDVMNHTTVTFNGYNYWGTGIVEFGMSDDEALNEVLSQGQCDVSDNGILANGIPTTVSCTFDSDRARTAGYELVNTSAAIMVDGLKDLRDIDLFDGVSVSWSVDTEEHTSAVSLNTPDPAPGNAVYSLVNYNDDGQVLVHASTDTLALRIDGCQVLNNQFDKIYDIGRRPDTYRDERIECTSSGGTWNSDTHTCTFPEPAPAQPIYTETMTPQGQAIVNAAYAQVGSRDVCSLVVSNALSAIGVDAFDRYPDGSWFLSPETVINKGYQVSNPMPGDVAYYYSNYSGTSSHVAIYIGNGQVVSGNFNGSTQIVNAYIGGLQSQPVYYRYY